MTATEIFLAFHTPLPVSGPVGNPSRQLCRSTCRPTMIATRRERAGRMMSISADEIPNGPARVVIEAPARNQRIVSASNLVNAPMEIVWDVLSDYDRLSDYIPNLALSERRAHPTDGIRVEQCGAQSILGFEFRASLVMDMTEVNSSSSHWRAIEFGLVTSRDFNEFEGLWRMERVDANKTALYYSVQIIPKGLVPVRAIEWRISEDVPENMEAVRQECERRRRSAVANTRREQMSRSKGRDA